MHKLIFLLTCITQLSFSQGNDNLTASAKDTFAPAKILKGNDGRFSFYVLAAENLNRVADDLIVKKKIDWAISVYRLSLKETLLSSTYTKLGKAYLLKGDKGLAATCFENALKLWFDNQEAAEALHGLYPPGSKGKGC